MDTGNKPITYQIKDTGDISEVLELVLEEAGYERQRIVKYVFTLEEALLKWRNAFPGESAVIFERSESKRDVILDIRLEGEKSNPIEIKEDGDDYTKYKNRILTGCGTEFRYSYKKGTNILRLKFPKKNIEKTLFVRMFMAICLPIALRQFLLAAITATDGFMLGFLSQDAMSGVAVVNSFINIFTLGFSAVTIGFGILVAQLWGKYEKKGISEALAITVRYGLLISLLFFAGGFFFPEEILGFYTNDANLISIGAGYLKDISITFILDGLTMIYGSVMVNTGRVVKMTIVSISTAVINLVLNAVLIFGLLGAPALGVKGAAIATDIAAAFGMIFMLVESIRDGMLAGIFRYFFTRSQYSATLFKLCGTVFLQRLSWGVGNNVITAILGHMGSDILAAKSMAMLVSDMMICFVGGLGDGAGILIGNDLGRNQFDMAERKAPWVLGVVLKAGLMTGMVTVALGALVMLLPIELTDVAAHYYRIMMLILAVRIIFGSMNNVLNTGFLFAGGETTYVSIVDIVCLWGCTIGLALLLVYVFNAPIVITLIVLLAGCELFSFPFKYGRYRRKTWLRNIT